MSLLSLDQDVEAARLRTTNSPRQAYEALAKEKAYDFTKAHNLRQTPESRARDEAILNKATAMGMDITPPADSSQRMLSGDEGALNPMQGVAPDPTPGQALNMFSRDYLEKVDRRAGLMDAFDILFAGRPSGNSKKYRDSAIAKYTDYVNNQAAQIALNGDYADSASFMGAFLRAGGDIEKALALGKVVDFGGSSDEYKEMTFSDPQNPNALYSGYIVERKGEAPQRFMRVADGSVVEVPYNYINKSSGGQNITVNAGTGELQKAYEKEAGKNWASTHSSILDGREFDDIRSENDRIDALSNSLEEGMVTGFGTQPMMALQRAFIKFVPPNTADSEFIKSLEDKVGKQEWWDAAAGRFIGSMLAMTKGAVSDREMGIFMNMIPALNKTVSGNKRLLQMMKNMNNMALAKQQAHIMLDEYALARGERVADYSTEKSRDLVRKFEAEARRKAQAEFYATAEQVPADKETYLEVLKILNPGADPAELKKVADRYFKGKSL